MNGYHYVNSVRAVDFLYHATFVLWKRDATEKRSPQAEIFCMSVARWNG